MVKITVVLYHDSDPILYDETGKWTFDEQNTIQEDNGELRTNTVLDRPLGQTPLLTNNLEFPEGLCKKSFHVLRGQVCCSTTIVCVEDIPWSASNASWTR